MDWLDLLAVQGTLKSLLQHHSLKASILSCSAFFTVQLSHLYMTTGKTIALTRWTFVGKVIISLLFNMKSFFKNTDYHYTCLMHWLPYHWKLTSFTPRNILFSENGFVCSIESIQHPSFPWIQVNMVYNFHFPFHLFESLCLHLLQATQ